MKVRGQVSSSMDAAQVLATGESNAVARPARSRFHSSGAAAGSGVRRLRASTRTTAAPRRHGPPPEPEPSPTLTDSPTATPKHDSGSLASTENAPAAGLPQAIARAGLSAAA